MKKNTIIDTIIDNGLIAEDSVVIIGLSGGPDSLCLLHALDCIADSYYLTLVPVHVNHKLRPEADDEADNVVRICERMDLDCNVFEADCAAMAEDMKISTEEAGRYIRYEIFDDVASQIADDGVPEDKIVIALGHNADDQSETVLFRLLRGTGIHGLSGIPAVRMSEGGYMIVRPLLGIRRAEIEKYIKDNRLHPNIDKSNSENDYTRNRIRNELIPYLEKNYNPNIREALRRFAGLAYLDDSLLTEIALSEGLEKIDVDADAGRVTLDISELKEDPPSVVSRIVHIVLQSLRLEMNASYELVTDIMSLIYSENPSARLDLPRGFRVCREYDSLIFAESDEDLTVRPDAGLAADPQIIMKKDFFPPEDSMYAAFDFDLFNEEYPGKVGEIILRTRQEGDYLPMKNGSKKIQDLLVDSKVKKSARDSILLVTIGSEVLWVLPSEYFKGKQEQEKGRFSQKYHITDSTERVLFIEIVNDI